MRQISGRLVTALMLGTCLGMLAAIPAYAQKRTDQLTAASAISGTQTFPICQLCGAGTEMTAATFAQLLTYIQANISVPVATGISGLGTNVATFLATPTSANMRAAITDETGTGAAVFAISPTLVTPVLGTPTSGDATNLINIPVANALGMLGTAHGGTGGTTPSGTLLDNITGFNTLGLVQRTGNGAYTLTVPGTGVMTFIGTPTGNILASWLASGAAVANLGFTPVTNARNLTAGTGLAGGGDLTADRTFSLAAITANSLLGNPTGSSAAPTAMAIPASCTLGITYAAGAFSCVTSTGGASPTIADTYGHSFTTPTQLSLAAGLNASGVNGGTVTIAQTSVVGRDLTAGDATIASTDANTTVPVANHTYTLPSAATTGFGSGFSFCLDNQSSGNATVTTSTSQFVMAGGNVSTITLRPGDQLCPQSDGTNYRPNPTINYIGLTAGLPVIGGGSGGILASATKSGNTSEFATSTGTKTSGNLVKWDANGNAVDSGIGSTGTGISGAVATLGWPAGVNPDQTPVLVVPSNLSSGMTITGISARVTALTGAAATIMVRKVASGAACSTGTALITASLDTNAGSANTVYNFTLTGSGAPSLVAGNEVCLDVTGGAAMASGTSIGGFTVAYTVP